MTREQILEAARVCVCGEREQDYGKPEDNFTTIAALWWDYLMGKWQAEGAVNGINAVDVACMMTLLKIARISSGNAKDDNWVDGAGYLACGGEIESRIATEE